MNKTLLSFSFSLNIVFAFGQINMEDSTAQAVTYWEKGQVYNYTVTEDKFKIKGGDTLSRETITYNAEVTVLETDDKSNTVQWIYKNVTSNSTDPLIRKLIGSSQDMKVIYKTNELGVFLEVVNWMEVRDYMQKVIVPLKKELKGKQGMDAVFKQLETTYSSKQAIESAAIKEIQQFHTFHGARYKLGEVLQGKLKAPNIYGSEPFDSDFTVYLDEINPDDNNYIMRSTQSIDKEQLITATLSYLTAMAKNMKVAPPKREELEGLKNEIEVASRIHTSGWIIYSVQTTTVTADNTTNVEERVIELQ